MSLQCFGTVHPTYFTVQYCSCNSNFVSLFFNPLFKFCTVATVPSGTVAAVVAFFQSSVCIFYYTATILRHCAPNVFHCAVLQLQQQFRESFFFLITLLFKFCTVATMPSGTVAAVVAFFQSFVCIFYYAATVLRHCAPNVFHCAALQLQQQFREYFFFFFL